MKEEIDMTNKEKYIHAFVEALEIEEEKVEGLKYQEIPEWDSVGHMSLIAELEDAFDIMMDTDDIIDFSSYDKGIELLKKYNIEIEV
jgi:acyl carrier protein